MKNIRFPLLLCAIMFFFLIACLPPKTARAEDASLPEKTVYLTFDDGPSTVVTGRILDTLAREKIKATFFIVSERAETRKETLRRIAEEGHTIGVHSSTHDYAKIYSSEQALREDICRCADFILKTTGKTPTVYRFPGGKSTPAREKLVSDMGYRSVGWNATCGDEEIRNGTSAQLLSAACSSSANKNTVILLLHDSAPHKNTAEALPEIIAMYRAQGYAFRSF